MGIGPDLNISSTFDTNDLSMQYVALSQQLENINFEENIDPFSDWKHSKHRNELLKWVKSLNFLHQTNNKNNNKSQEKEQKLNEQKKQEKTIEIITTLQQKGMCAIADLIHINNDKLK